MRLEDLDGKATISIPEAGEICGLKKSHAYAAAAAGQIPVISFGNRKRVPVARLLALLGREEKPRAEEIAIPHDPTVPTGTVK